MKRVYIEDWWPESWKYSYSYDLQEVYGEIYNFGYTYAYQNRFNTTLGLIAEVLPRGSTILDVAAAQGNFTLTLAEMGYKITWNDLRADLAEYVRMKHEKGDVSYSAGNVFDFSYHECFDCVLITEVIEHVAHPDEFLKKAAMMVKPGGYIVMSTPNGGYINNNLPRFSDCDNPSAFENKQFKPDSDGHIFLLWEDEIKLLGSKAGLKLEKHLLLTNILTAGHMKSEICLKIFPKSFVFFLEKATDFLPNLLKNKITANSCSRYFKSP